MDAGVAPDVEAPLTSAFLLTGLQLTTSRTRTKRLLSLENAFIPHLLWTILSKIISPVATWCSAIGTREAHDWHTLTFSGPCEC